MWGFLIGETVQQVKDTISDSQINNVQVETNTYVFDCVSFNRDRFNKLSSDMTRQQIADLLPGKHQNIIGWYSFRRNSTLRPSYRERLFHQRLESLSSMESNSLLFCLCSAKASTNNSTHSLDHIVLHLDNNIFKKKSVDIINLGDTTHTDYLTIPSHTVSSKHGTFNSIMRKHEKEFLNTEGDVEVKRIQKLNKAISRQLQAISHEVIESESRCSVLEHEISKLRRHTKQKTLEKQQQQVPTLTHQNNTLAQGTRERSVDDILCMDITDDTSNVEALIDQPTSLNSTHSNCDHDDDNNCETMETENDSIMDHLLKCDTDISSLAGHKDLSEKETSMTLLSDNTESDKLSANCSASKRNSSNMRHQTQLKHPADPFSYVGDMMAAASMKSSTKSKTSGSGLNRDTDFHSISKMEEDNYMNKKSQVGKLKTENKSAKLDRNLKHSEKHTDLNDSTIKNGTKVYSEEDTVTSDDSSFLEPTSPVY
ncbi:hypothetical protein ACF0H5_009292 [Mactra antiquata]